MGSPTRRANDAAGFALCLCVYRHLSRFVAAYSPKCLEGEFSEVRIAPVLCIIPRDRAHHLSGGPGSSGPGLWAEGPVAEATGGQS